MNTPGPRGRLLVVDDEPAIVEVLATSLRFLGHQVATAGNGREALRAAREGHPELMLLDVLLPDVDGFEVVRRLRAEGQRVAVMFLTARDGRQEVVKGLALGGDDYVTKPFALDEVAARVHALLRRSRPAADGDDPVLRCADLELDTATYEVRRAGQPVELSPTEFRLLRCLLEAADRVLTRTQLLERVWHYDDFQGDDSVVNTYISYLRRKLDALGPPLIHTQRGVGYRLRPPRG